MSASLDEWIGAQWPRAAEGMLRSVSPLTIIKKRPGFGQSIRARRGAIVASPVLAAYDPDPDYFFHWYRDSAIVADALRLLHTAASGQLSGAGSAGALAHFGDFVRFSLGLQGLDGRLLVRDRAWRARVQPDFERYVRADEELSRVHGEIVAGESRVNPDGTLDISRWGRPQHDGPPLRALTGLRWLQTGTLPADLRAPLSQLLRADLHYALRHARAPCIDIWEEEVGRHYYTLRISAAALELGAPWLAAQGQAAEAAACEAEAQRLYAQLDDYWLSQEGYYRSRVLSDGSRSGKELDIAVILATVHARSMRPRHSALDERIHATLDRLDALFDRLYPINRQRTSAEGPALGRYEGDVYYSGGAYFFSTLGAAELCYQAAALVEPAQRERWRERGEGYLSTVRRHTPPDGQMAEQFDQRSGAPSSARHLAWSYAAFLSCVHARRMCRA